MVIMVIVCSGMADAIQWAKTYGGAHYDWANSIQQTSDGGYIVAGGTASFGESESYLWVLKLDSSGNVQWQKAYGGIGFDNAYSIQQTPDGGYIVAGLTDSFGKNIDLWVLKLDSSGNVQWQKVYGGVGGDGAASIQQTPDGGYIVAGETDSFGKGFTDFWILKLDSSGNVQWQKVYGGDGEDVANSLQQTSDGGYIVAGGTISFGKGLVDLWILKLDSSGNVQWQRTYGGDKDDVAKSIEQTSDGGYIVAGMTESFGDIKGDLWVLKLDSSGNVQWQKAYGGGGDDGAISVKQTSDGGYIVAGGTDSFGKGNEDLWILKLDSSGNVQWQRTYGGDGFDQGSSIQQTPDGGYIVAGATDSFGKNIDLWVLKLDANGEIKDCPAMGTSNATVNNTDATVANTNASISDTNATVADTNATITNTTATVTVVCPSSFSDISVAPTSHDFGDVNVGSLSAPQTFNISNTGTADLVIGTITIKGTNTSEFAKQSDTCSGQTLSPATNCTVLAVFSPASAGSKSATLSIPSNDPDTPTLNVPLSGTGVVPQYTITVTKAGGGSGTVTSSPAGICCGTSCSTDDCSEPYNSGTVVTLTATADTGSVFTGWSGGCSGTGTCTVTMDADKSVTATFTKTTSITVKVPNGNESWEAGKTYTISWAYTGNPGSYVKIELYKGGSLNRTIKSKTSIGSGGSGSYNWPIPATQAGGTDYKIKVTSTSDSKYTDTSDNNFTIMAATITVKVPNGGENWKAGTTQTIKWTYTANPGANVKIELFKGGKLNSTITKGTSIGSGGNGSYNWKISSKQAAGTDYKITITSTTNSTIKDTSDNNFTISK